VQATKFALKSQREKFAPAGRSLKMPSNAIESERGCVVLQEPQQVAMAGPKSSLFPWPPRAKLLRLVCGKAARPERSGGRMVFELRFANCRQPAKLP
jgi:hypothetical protein